MKRIETEERKEVIKTIKEEEEELQNKKDEEKQVEHKRHSGDIDPSEEVDVSRISTV